MEDGPGKARALQTKIQVMAEVKVSFIRSRAALLLPPLINRDPPGVALIVQCPATPANIGKTGSNLLLHKGTPLLRKRLTWPMQQACRQIVQGVEFRGRQCRE
jgi:hypothetical protein